MAILSDEYGPVKTSKIGNLIPQCPFFTMAEQAGAGRRIVCEGPIPGGSLSIYFRKKADFENQVNIFCCDRFKNCEIYRMTVNEKYGSD